MDPSVEIFAPARWYARSGWSLLAAAVVMASIGFRAPLVLVVAGACAGAGLVFVWLSSRPVIRVGENQFNIGERAIAWREVKEVNRVRVLSPLVLRLKLTNSRHKTLIYPGEGGRVEQLVHLLRRNSHLATFDGVAYRDYWTWSTKAGMNAQRQSTQPVADSEANQAVKIVSHDEEDEIERMFQKLKSVGSLDARIDPSNLDED